MKLSHRLKIAYHKDLAKHPLTHAWILNLYRAGEDHHFTVEDYFPYEHALDPTLREQMHKHMQDEARHGNLFLKFLKKNNWDTSNYIDDDVYNNVVRQHTPLGFQIFENDSSETKRLKLAHFLAHAHFLEKRVAQSLCFHQEACDQLGKTDILETLQEIHKDESHHVNYTREAVYNLLTRQEAKNVFTLHKQAEKKANVDFSQKQIQYLLNQRSSFLSKSNSLILKVFAFLNHQTANHVL